MDFPMPDFGSEIETILDYALDWLALIDSHNFLSVLAAFALALTVITWVIRTLRNPPQLDI